MAVVNKNDLFLLLLYAAGACGEKAARVGEEIVS